MIPAPMPVPILTTTTFVVAGGDARAPLPERQDVDVVVDPDRARRSGGEPLADRVAVPAGHDRRRDRPAGLELDRARARRCRSPTAGPGCRVVVRRSGSNSVVDAVEAGLRAGLDPGRLVVVAEDPAVERRHRDVDARRAEVGDEDVAGVGPERQLARRPAAGARPDVALDDQAALDQLADALGDDRPAEPGPLDELGARSRPPEADLVEDDDERVERLVGQRPRRGRAVADRGRTATMSDRYALRPARRAADFCT